MDLRLPLSSLRSELFDPLKSSVESSMFPPRSALLSRRNRCGYRRQLLTSIRGLISPWMAPTRLIAYAACLEGSDPVCLLDKRVNAKRVPGYVFDKASLLQYDHMSFGGEPVQVESEEEAEELMQKNEKDSIIEAEILSAPPKLVYNKFILRLARELLGAVVNQWNEHVFIIDKIIPQNWKDEPAARILELCILHLAMAEITTLGNRHQIVINEAIDLTKRFCDGSAPRIINGCLRTFIKDHSSRISIV